MEHGRSNIFHSSGGEVLEIGPQGISLLGKGITGWFAAEVSENFEGLITWTADPAINVEFPNGTNGPVVSVLGRFFGDTDLRMNIKDFIGPPPQTTVRIMPTNSVPVNVWIVISKEHRNDLESNILFGNAIVFPCCSVFRFPNILRTDFGRVLR